MDVSGSGWVASGSTSTGAGMLYNNAHNPIHHCSPPPSDGAVPEIRVLDPQGSTSITKWRVLGRLSHETASVMSDNKTVYTTDDSNNGGARLGWVGLGWGWEGAGG